MKAFTDIEKALAFARAFRGRAEEFCLPIDDSLQDPIGANMTLVLDHLLARGWIPAGYEQMVGYRIYHYKE